MTSSPASSPSPAAFIHEPLPDQPGWFSWNTQLLTGFNAKSLGFLSVRQEGERSVRLRMFPGPQHSNLNGVLHGGVSLALIDVSLFAACGVIIGMDQVRGVTVDVSCQFIGSGNLTAPLDAIPEILRETRRMVFLRGLVMQDETLVASFTGTVRKPSIAG